MSVLRNVRYSQTHVHLNAVHEWAKCTVIKALCILYNITMFSSNNYGNIYSKPNSINRFRIYDLLAE